MNGINGLNNNDMSSYSYIQQNQQQQTQQTQQTQVYGQPDVATKVDLSSDGRRADVESRQLSEDTKQYLENNNVDMPSESSNFSKQNVLSQAGSIIQAHNSTNSANVARLTA
jgi:hypothetical protein